MLAGRLARQSCQTLADLFFPPHCPACGLAVAAPHMLCRGCDGTITRITTPRCDLCSHPFDGMMDQVVCPNCRGHEFHFECAVAVMRGAGAVREIIHSFKYGRQQHLRRILAAWLLEGLADPRLSGEPHDLLVPVPLHPAREREREFNQAALLAVWASRETGIPCKTVLARTRYTTTQTQFDRRRRMRNLRGAFKLRKNSNVTNLRILLVDDVLTTGSTLDECARVLLAGGAQSVRAIAVARG